ncbi:uncharacterized protein N7515_008337 [Penicillium bovifimosum]|uniref:Uncharacterized protein n=1 Tax=Penicillium bovifimosum TaxID=126998 RepID=A0A9W9KXE5_9EURO|nr:uncharacterized protein N7515_008337 [Penicillium bovifimosum]KAJ5124512.1 hypothetical protein N7515_008337 [Penicillium bovifimosum]
MERRFDTAGHALTQQRRKRRQQLVVSSQQEGELPVILDFWIGPRGKKLEKIITVRHHLQPRMILGFDDFILHDLFPAIPETLYRYEPREKDILILAAEVEKSKTPVAYSACLDYRQDSEDLYIALSRHNRPGRKDIHMSVVIWRDPPTQVIKKEPAFIRGGPASIRNEPAPIRKEPAFIKQEPVFIKQEPVFIKQEP